MSSATPKAHRGSPETLDRAKQKISELLDLINPFAPAQSQASIASAPLSSNSPLRSLTASPARYSSPAKRFRRRRAEKLKRSGNQATSGSRTPISSNSAEVGHTSSDKQPIYAPWSRHKLLERMSTFSRLENSWNYDATITITSPLLWSRCGWACARDDLNRTIVKCELCGASCSFDEIAKSFVSKSNGIIDAIKIIKTAHAETCPWPKRGCDDKLYSLSLSLDLDKSINDFITRLRQLLLSQFPTEVEIVVPTAVDTRVLTKYQDSLGLGTRSDSETQKFKRAFSLAIAGWESTDSGIKCSQCFRTYTSRETTQFDVLQGHIGYCPWVNPVGGRDPGWKLLLAILRSSTGTNGNAHQTSAYPSYTTTESIVSPMSLTTMDEENERQNDKDRKARIERLREMYIYRPRKPRKSMPGASTIVR
ncbi:C3HC zinc finger-like-domain-containing protein [Lipomyces kononenkoae]|uniref:C3HC zinc finger-like-domain-containing protein n=1 Tax=Lipomyces kononenkoae TaxID=34357 RepID=A0ACC3T9E3_LIPKO